jgi:AcrR family transcriptional regulator
MRYKEFNNNKVLEDCITLFWENSFNGTPISTIVTHTHVNRYSLYNEFENKQGILYESLKLYKERYSNQYIKKLDSDGGLIETLKTFFSAYLYKKTHQSGCFIIYIASELGDNNEVINSFLKTYLAEIESKFIQLLRANNHSEERSEIIASNLILLFCNSMCFCYIQDVKERQRFVDLNLDIILTNYESDN